MTLKRALAACLVVALLGAGAALAKSNLIVLGASSTVGVPACPPDPCQVVGKVTGFQTAIGATQKKPFLAPANGKIVAWSIKLSAPTKTQINFFNNFFGGPASARISVIKLVPKQKPARYKLLAQSPVQQLNQVMGKTTTFTLQRPLKIRKGQIAALTVPTWAPAFQIGLDQSFSWRGSRSPGKCLQPAQIKAGKAQQALGSNRIYGCAYPTARLVYSATLSPG